MVIPLVSIQNEAPSISLATGRSIEVSRGEACRSRGSRKSQFTNCQLGKCVIQRKECSSKSQFTNCQLGKCVIQRKECSSSSERATDRGYRTKCSRLNEIQEERIVSQSSSSGQVAGMFKTIAPRSEEFAEKLAALL